MADRTPAQVAADNKLDDAIAEAVRAYEVVPDGEVVTTWAVVGASTGEDVGRTNYFNLFPGGVQPGYIAVGLLRVSERHLLSDLEDD